MAFSLFYFDAVALDIRDTKEWYKRQKPGLEKYFAKEVANCISRLQKDPFIYEVKYRNVRTALTAIFPYAIHFYVNESSQQIFIIAIVHQNRNPSLAQNRDPDE